MNIKDESDKNYSTTRNLIYTQLPKKKEFYSNLSGGLWLQGFGKKPFSKNPLVTIVTVVFNGADFIEETIQNVVNQSYENIEYIIIDGASTDGTLGIIRKYDKVISLWISEPDHGIYDAMNKGVSFATGQWINFMNSGDRFYSLTTVEDVFSILEDNPDFVYGDHCVRYDSGLKRIQKAGELKKIWGKMVFSHQSLFVKTQLMKEKPFSDRVLFAADYEFIYFFFLKGKRFFNSRKIISAIARGDDASYVHQIRSTKDRWQISRRFQVGFFKKTRTDLFYSVLIFFVSIKMLIKRVLPKKLVLFLIKLKYCIKKGMVGDYGKKK